MFISKLLRQQYWAIFFDLCNLYQISQVLVAYKQHCSFLFPTISCNSSVFACPLKSFRSFKIIGVLCKLCYTSRILRDFKNRKIIYLMQNLQQSQEGSSVQKLFQVSGTGHYWPSKNLCFFQRKNEMQQDSSAFFHNLHD